MFARDINNTILAKGDYVAYPTLEPRSHRTHLGIARIQEIEWFSGERPRLKCLVIKHSNRVPFYKQIYLTEFYRLVKVTI